MTELFQAVLFPRVGGISAPDIYKHFLLVPILVFPFLCLLLTAHLAMQNLLGLIPMLL